MEGDLLKKFKMSLTSSTSILCRICGLSISKSGELQNEIVYQKFCKEINYLREAKSEVNCPLCPNCLKTVRIVVEEKEGVEEVEGEVRKLQRRLLVLLGRLKCKLTGYYEGMKKLEEIIGENVLRTPDKMLLAELLERKEVALVRYRIVDVVCDLKIFQGQLDVKGAAVNGDLEDPLGFDSFPTEDVDVKEEPDFGSEFDDSFAVEGEEEEEDSSRNSHPVSIRRGKRRRLTKTSYSDVGDECNADVDMEADDYIPEEEEESDDDRNEEPQDNGGGDLPPPPPDPALQLSDTYPELNKLTDFKRLVFSRIIYHFQQELIKKGRKINISSKPIDPSDFSSFFDKAPTPFEPQNAPFRYDQKRNRIFIGEIEILVNDEINSVNCSKCDYTFNYLGHRILPHLVQDHIIEAHFPPTTTRQRDINIRKRMRGEAYTGFAKETCPETGKIITKPGIPRQAREMGPPCTSTSCIQRKDFYCYHFTEEDRFEIFFKFWKIMSWKEREEFVKSNTQIIPIKRSRCGKPPEIRKNRSGNLNCFFTLNGRKVRVCANMFQSTLGIIRDKILAWANPTKYKKPEGWQRKPPAPRPKKEPISHPCPTCGKLFSRRFSLNEHEKTHVKTNCPGCGLQVSQKSLQKHIKQSCKVLVTDPPYFVCPQCGKKQKGAGGLRDHLNRIHGPNAFSKGKSDISDRDLNSQL